MHSFQQVRTICRTATFQAAQMPRRLRVERVESGVGFAVFARFYLLNLRFRGVFVDGRADLSHPSSDAT